MDNDGKIVTLSGPKTTSLNTCDGKLIAKVGKNTFDKFQMEGTGKLSDGR